MMSSYDQSDEYAKLRAVQTYLRYLLRKMDDKQEMPLEHSLPMIDHIDTLMKQLGALKGQLNTMAHAEMLDLNVEQIETEEWTATLLNKPTRIQVDNQAVAEALLDKILQKELKRNKRVPAQTVRSIVTTTFWTLIEAGSFKWGKTKLRKHQLNLDEYSEEGTIQNRVELKKKTS